MQRSIATSLRRAATTASSARTTTAASASGRHCRHVAIAAASVSPLYRPYEAPSWTPRRTFTSSSVRAGEQQHQYQISQLTDREYHDVADRTMDRLTEYLEETIEAFEDQPYDVEYSASMCGKSGVLTVRLGEKGTYVLNKQPPNKQIWLSSPISGPKRYDWDSTHHVWFYHRDGDLLHDLLNRELRQSLNDETIEVDLAERDDD